MAMKRQAPKRVSKKLIFDKKFKGKLKPIDRYQQLASAIGKLKSYPGKC